MISHLKRQIRKFPILLVALKALRSSCKRTVAFLALALPIPAASKVSPLVILYSGSLSGLVRLNLVKVLKSRRTLPSAQLNQLASFINLLGMNKAAMLLFKMALRKRDVIVEEKYQELLQVFRPFSSETYGAFGHIALMDFFIKAERLGIIDRKTNIIVDALEDFSNPVLAGYFNRLFKASATVQGIVPGFFPEEIEEPISLFRTKGNQYLWLEDFTARVQMKWFERFQRQCIAPLRTEDREAALRYLDSYGFARTNWFVTMHIREGGDNLRDLRNADPNTYIDAVKLIIREGGWVFRIGSKNMSSAMNFESARFIDFSSIEDIPPHIDIFLLSNCRFFVGTGSGPIAVAGHVFGRPVAATNWAPLGARLSWQDQVILPKIYINSSNSTTLNMSTRMRGRFSSIESSRRLKELGYIPVNNSAAQLASLTRQMLDATQDGRFDADSFLGHKLQSKFLELMVDNGRLCPAYCANATLDEYPEFVE